MDDAPVVKDIAAAEKWIGVLHRRSCRDAEQIAKLADRVSRRERPWWHPARRVRRG